MSSSEWNGDAAWTQLERAIGTSSDAGGDGAVTAEGVQRYFRHALGDAPVHAAAVRLSMRGRIKIGRWLPFRATQLLAPRLGTVWRASVAGIVRGSDRYVGGAGAMDWRLLNRLPIVHADGPDVSRSAAERAAGESIWAPAAMRPTDDVTWTAVDPNHLHVAFSVGDHPVQLRHSIDADGRLESSSFDRWGDPDRTGTWAQHPFGVEVDGEGTFDGVTIPARGRAGWHHGTARWEDGVFFQFEITGYELISRAPDT